MVRIVMQHTTDICSMISDFLNIIDKVNVRWDCLKTFRPTISDFYSYQLVNNLFESLNPNRSDEMMQMATTEAAFPSDVRWLGKPMKTYPVAEAYRMTRYAHCLVIGRPLAFKRIFDYFESCGEPQCIVVRSARRRFALRQERRNNDILFIYSFMP